MQQFESVDAYLDAIENPKFKVELDRLRRIVTSEAPTAIEHISYGMPGYKLNGPLVYYAAFKKHCSLFGATTVGEFEQELSSYKTSKGTIQFTPDNPIPEDLVRRLVRRRIELNSEKKAKKKS